MIKPICAVNELSHLCITPHGIWRFHHGLAACFLCKTRITRTTRKRENATTHNKRELDLRFEFCCVLLRLARCARCAFSYPYSSPRFVAKEKKLYFYFLPLSGLFLCNCLPIIVYLFIHLFLLNYYFYWFCSTTKTIAPNRMGSDWKVHECI